MHIKPRPPGYGSSFKNEAEPNCLASPKPRENPAELLNEDSSWVVSELIQPLQLIQIFLSCGRKEQAFCKQLKN